jgi:zinc protease
MVRRLVVVVALVLTSGSACTEPPRPETPRATATSPAIERPPSDPAPVVDGDVTVLHESGIRILVKRIPGKELSAMRLYMRGGARDWGAADAGKGQLALSVATSGGTERLDKSSFTRRLSELGSEVDWECGADYSALTASTLSKHWDETFALLADVFLRPALPASELEIQRTRQISRLKSEQEDPDRSLGLLLHDTLYKNHPLEHRAVGTVESVSRLDLDTLKKHLEKLRRTSRLLFVAVGDVEPPRVAAAVRAAFGALPHGGYKETPFPPIGFDRAALRASERKLATNYFQGAFSAPGYRDPDLPEAMVAMSLLSHRLFEEIRTKRNLSYAPSAGLWYGRTPSFGTFYASSVDPAATFKVIADEVRRLQNEPVPEKELAGTKALYLTGYLMQSESTGGQAAMLANAELVGGDWRLSRTLPDRIRAVTPAAVQAYAKKYIRHVQVVGLGDPAKMDPALFQAL